MNKHWRVAAVITALSILLGSMSGTVAQEGTITGGYAETSITDPEVVAAANFAIKAQARKQGARLSLLSVEQAEVQVVAGLNYMMKMKVKINGQPRDVTAVVYKNLKRQYSLSSWEVAANSAGQAPASSASSIEQLVKTLAEAYEAKSLGRLDPDRPYLGRVKIVIEHSLADDNAKDRFEIKNFRTLEEAERWLRSREIEELPGRSTRPLVRCQRGLCTYDFEGGINHKQLYLQKISYGLRRGRPYLKTIFLLDGD